MIDVKELRVGNLVLTKTLKYNETPCEVKHIGNRGILGLIICKEQNPHLIERDAEDEVFPIPITEEWLKKIGAYNEPLEGPLGPYTNYWYIKDQEGELIMLWSGSNDDWMYVINGHHDLNRKFFTLKYFHQLQNITFALTGKELTLNK